ncbi:MAG: cytidine deaminase [Ilumatobacteraceae bacterium]
MDQQEHDDRELIDNARTARARSYVPYSSFRMGASVRTEDGSVHPGAVVENVSLGLAMCAERIALFGSVAAGGTRPVGLALVAPRTAGQLTYPCGACLQVALELGGPELRIIVADADGESVERATVGELLPRGPHKG